MTQTVIRAARVWDANGQPWDWRDGGWQYRGRGNVYGNLNPYRVPTDDLDAYFGPVSVAKPADSCCGA